jgi:hypothetical protein
MNDLLREALWREAGILEKIKMVLMRIYEP